MSAFLELALIVLGTLLITCAILLVVDFVVGMTLFAIQYLRARGGAHDVFSDK